MNKIPLIIPVFNQLTYLKNLINWFRWYYPENPVVILNNASNYVPLEKYFEEFQRERWDNVVLHFEENNFIKNLRIVLDSERGKSWEYYIISDPDIMPHPATPTNFLEVFRSMIENHKFHRAGFNLITDNLPTWLNEREMIIGNEKELLEARQILTYENYKGYKAPLDTTFCLYKRDNGGWSAPMGGDDWGNCLRLFEAFHLGWYIDGERLNGEMKNYFHTSKYRVPGEPSAGKNNNRPKQYQ